MGDLNLPFEENPPGQTIPADETLLSGGVVVMAGHVPALPDGAKLPVLIFRFARADGAGFYPPVVLGSGAEDLAALPELVESAVLSALRAAGGDS